MVFKVCGVLAKSTITITMLVTIYWTILDMTHEDGIDSNLSIDCVSLKL